MPLLSEDAVTFGLAAVGYVLLAKDAALRLLGHRWTFLGPVAAIVIAVHVGLVWVLRFDGSMAVALEKGLPAFVIFHAAFGLILVAPFLSGRIRDWVVWVAFAVVSVGVLSATLRYPQLHLDFYAIPLWAAFLVVLGILVRRLRASFR